MTRQRETPVSLRRQAEGSTGVRDTGRSVAPGWAHRRQGADLVRCGGEYMTPEALHRQIAAEAAQWREGCRGNPCADPSGFGPQGATRAAPAPGAATPSTPPADRWQPPEPASLRWDAETGEVLPCRSLETIQPSGRGKGGERPARGAGWAASESGLRAGVECRPSVQPSRG